MSGAFQLVCAHVHACGSIFLGMCIHVCVCALQCVCVVGQDQWSKSTLERVAQSSSPTKRSLSLPLSLSSRRCSRAPSSSKVEEFTKIGSKRAQPRAKWKKCEHFTLPISTVFQPSINLNKEQPLTGCYTTVNICSANMSTTEILTMDSDEDKCIYSRHTLICL